jgi:hypothetical protein
MASDLASGGTAGSEPAWDEIQAVLEEIARLSLRTMPRAEFHAAVMAKTVHALSAVAGAIWWRAADGSLSLDAECRLSQTDLQSSSATQAAHLRLLNQVCAAADPIAVSPGQTLAGRGSGDEAVTENGSAAANPSQYWLALAPLKAGSNTIGLLELVEPAMTPPAARQGHLQFLAAVSELAADFHRQAQVRELAVRESQWQRLEQFIQQIHASLDLRATAYAIVNDGRRLIDCDRVSIAACSGDKCRTLAISGVDAAQRRSDAVQRLEALGRVVARIGEPLWFPADRERLPPETERAIDAHLDVSHARLLAAIPLKPAPAAGERASNAENPTLGVLFVEQFRTAALDAPFQQRVQTVSRHAASALKNALDYDSLPLMPLERVLKGLRWFTRARQLPKTALSLLLVIGLGLALVLVPADFTIEARGELQPSARREIYAPDDAIVSEVRITAGQHVQSGDVLVALRKPQLEFELHRVLGEMQTARKRLSAIQAARLGSDHGKPETPEHYQQLTAEEEEIKESLASLQQQDQVLRSQQADLQVKSPIDGDVLTWNVQQLLETRPVQRGKTLLTVGDLAGDWQLELRLPDHHAGYVLDARRDLRAGLPVTFLLATDPGISYAGRVERVGLATTSDEVYGSNVPVFVAIDRRQLGDMRPGATVIGKIHCGRRSIGFVWFHDLISVIRSRVLF